MKQRAHAIKGRSIHNDSASELDWPEPGSSSSSTLFHCCQAPGRAHLDQSGESDCPWRDGMPGLSSPADCPQDREILLCIPRHLQMEKLEWVMGFTHASIVVFSSLHDWLEVVAFINLPSSWAEHWSGAAVTAWLQHCPGLWLPGGCSCSPNSDANRGSAFSATTWEQRHWDL